MKRWHVSWSALPATGGLKAEYIYDGDGKLVKTIGQRQNLAAGILPTGSSAVIHADTITNGDVWANSGSGASREFG